MSLYFGARGWLECDNDLAVVVREDLQHLKNKHHGSREWEICLPPWAASKNPHGLLTYFVYAADLNYKELGFFRATIERWCSFGLGLNGFFYVDSEDSIAPQHIKVTNDQIEIMEPAPQLIEPH